MLFPVALRSSRAIYLLLPHSSHPLEAAYLAVDARHMPSIPQHQIMEARLVPDHLTSFFVAELLLGFDHYKL